MGAMSARRKPSRPWGAPAKKAARRRLFRGGAAGAYFFLSLSSADFSPANGLSLRIVHG